MKIKVKNEEADRLARLLDNKHDPESERMKRFLGMADLSRTEGSPISELVERIVNLPRFKDFDTIEIPEIVPADTSFDLFNFPPDHPARSKSDTYFVDEGHILRPHTTVMWYYYLTSEKVKERMANKFVLKLHK